MVCPALPPAAPATANKPAKSCDTANHPSPERKSPPPVDCCKTTAPPATNVHQARPSPSANFQPPQQQPAPHPQIASPAVSNRAPDNSEKYAQPNAADWQSPQTVKKTARPISRPAPDKPPPPARPLRPVKSPRPAPESAAPAPAVRATPRRASLLFCAAPPPVRSPCLHWPARVRSQTRSAANPRSTPEISRIAAPPRHTPLSSTPRNKAPGTSSSPNIDIPEKQDRAVFLSGTAGS